LSAVLPLAAAQDAEVPLQRLRCFNLLNHTILHDDGGKMIEANIDAAGRSIHGNRIWYLRLHRQAHKPTVGLPTHRRRQDAALHLRMLLELDGSQPRKLYCQVQDFDCSSEPEAVVTALLLELRVAYLAAFLEATEEVPKRPVQVPKRLLRRTLGHLIHPRELRLLQPVQLSMLLNSVCALAGLLVQFDPSGKPPVVGKPGCSGMLRQQDALLPVRVKLVAVGTVNLHAGWPP